MAVATDRSARPLVGSEHDVAEAGPVSAVPAPAARPTGRLRWVAPTAIALVIALVAALVAVIWFGIKVVQGFGVEQARAGALDAAKEVATNLVTYDVATVDEDTTRLLEGLTPSFAGAFTEDQKGFRKNVAEGQVKSSGTVTEAGVRSFDPNSNTAQVLVSVRAKIINKQVPAGQDRDYRIELMMIDNGGWRAERAEFVG